MEMYNIRGRKVMTVKYNFTSRSGSSVVDVGNLSSGVYFVKISQANNYAVAKLVILK